MVMMNFCRKEWHMKSHNLVLSKQVEPNVQSFGGPTDQPFIEGFQYIASCTASQTTGFHHHVHIFKPDPHRPLKVPHWPAMQSAKSCGLSACCRLLCLKLSCLSCLWVLALPCDQRKQTMPCGKPPVCWAKRHASRNVIAQTKVSTKKCTQHSTHHYAHSTPQIAPTAATAAIRNFFEIDGEIIFAANTDRMQRVISQDFWMNSSRRVKDTTAGASTKPQHCVQRTTTLTVFD